MKTYSFAQRTPHRRFVIARERCSDRGNLNPLPKTIKAGPNPQPKPHRHLSRTSTPRHFVIAKSLRRGNLKNNPKKEKAGPNPQPKPHRQPSRNVHHPLFLRHLSATTPFARCAPFALRARVLLRSYFLYWGRSNTLHITTGGNAPIPPRAAFTMQQR